MNCMPFNLRTSAWTWPICSSQLAANPKEPTIQEKAIKFCINDEINDSKEKQLWQIQQKLRGGRDSER